MLTKMGLIEDIKKEYEKDKVRTLFMGTIVLLTLLTYFKPDSTSGFLASLGISAMNFILLSIFILVIWWFGLRKK